jgi:hypothetical protein
MIVVTMVLPKRMLAMSVTVCLISTILISVEGGQTANYLFAGASLYGFGASWLYGSGVAWTAEHMDVVVRTLTIFYSIHSTVKSNCIIV